MTRSSSSSSITKKPSSSSTTSSTSTPSNATNFLQAKIQKLISQTHLSSDLELSLRYYSRIHEEREMRERELSSSSSGAVNNNQQASNGHNSASTVASNANNATHLPHQILNTIEQAHILQFKKFLRDYTPITQQKELLRQQISELGHLLHKIDLKFQAYDEETSQYIQDLKQLQKRYQDTSQEMTEVQRFLRDYQLSQKEIYVLSQGDIRMDLNEIQQQEEQQQEGNTNTPSSAMISQPGFFTVLKKVHDIREKATEIVRGSGRHASGDTTHNNLTETPARAWVEVMEEMTMYQDSAYARLSEWIQEKCRAFLVTEQQQDETSLTQIESELRNAIKVLQERPVLLQCCISEIVNARKQTLRQKFFNALTGRGGNSAPLEMHAYDPVIYVGDILAWVHQNIAAERELIFSLLDVERSNKAHQSRETAVKMLNNITEKLERELEQRIDTQIFQSETPLELQNYFRIAHLCELYASTLGKLLNGKRSTGEVSRASLCILLLRLKDTAMEHFFEELERNAQRLMKQDSIQISTETLTAPEALVHSLQTLSDIMNTYSQSVVPEERREEDFSSVLDKILNPLLSSLQKVAEQSASTSQQCVFLINCYQMIQNELSHYKFTTTRVESIEADMNQKVEQLLQKQANAMLEDFGFQEKLSALEADDKSPLSERISRDSMRDFLQSFYQRLFSMGTDGIVDASLLKKISNVKLRYYAISRLVKELSVSYDKIYTAIMDESNGYSKPEELAYHSPAQVRILLEDGSNMG